MHYGPKFVKILLVIIDGRDNHYVNSNVMHGYSVVPYQDALVPIGMLHDAMCTTASCSCMMPEATTVRNIITHAIHL